MDKFEYISNEIRKFNKSITIDGSFGNADFATLFQRYPKLSLYIAGFKAVPQGFGLFGGGKTNLVFTYKNTHVKYEEIYPCKEVREMVNCIAYNLKKYNTRIAYLLPNQTLMNNFVREIQTGSLSAQHPFFKSFRTTDGGAIPSLSVYYFILEIEYHVSADELKEMERVIDAEVNRITQMLFDPLMPKEAKVLLAHNYLCYTATYDPSYSGKAVMINPYSHSAYGALIKKVCVCHGFAEAFKRILNRGGVTCEVISGAINATGVNHAWNIVKIDDDYYHVDVTFDDQSDIIFNYFMKKDDEMRDRKWSTESYPPCKGSKNIMLAAKSYINLNKSKLILKGLKLPMLKTL